MLVPQGRQFPPVARLLVLVPDGPVPVVELAQRLWHLAAPAGWAVFLLGMAASPERELPLRRALALLSAHTRHDPVVVGTRVVVAGDWLAVLRPLWRPGDLVVCFGGQPRAPGRRRDAALPQAVLATLQVPVYVIEDGPLPAAGRRWLAARPWLWAAASLGVIAAFFALQAWIQRWAPVGAGTALLGLSVLVEFGLLGLAHHTLMRE